MQVTINELVSHVRAVDGESVLAPATLNRVIGAVLEAVHQEADHQQRISEEQSLQNYQQGKRRQG